MPRWSRSGTAWDGSSPRITLALTAVIAVAVGAFVGLLIGNRGGSGSTSNPNAAIADSSYKGMATAEPNEAGAVKAATSFIVGLPDLALLSPSVQNNEIPTLFAVNASQDSRATLTTSLSTLRSQLIPTGSTAPTARIVTLPASYKSSLNTDRSVTVQIWYASVLADPIGPKFRSSWSTVTLGLAYNEGWKILSLSNSNGPVPDLYTVDGQSGDFNAAQAVLDRSYAFRHALAP